MNPTECQEFVTYLEIVREAYDQYRETQEREHAHLSRRGSIVEWNILVRQKQVAIQKVENAEHRLASRKQQWINLGTQRSRAEYSAVREKISQLQLLLTRILTCDRMIESLLYSGGYLQSVTAYRSSRLSDKPGSIPTV
jgi:hypothetical protein